MSLNVALNTAVSGLIAQQQAIGATSENIANVNSPDFARRQVNFFTDAIPGQFAGVSAEITRAAADRFLQAAGYGANAGAGSSSVVAEAIARVEASLGAPGDNLSFANKLNDAFAAFAELSAAPSSNAARAVAVGALGDAFAAFDRTLGAVDSETAATDARLDTQIARLNVLLEEIYNLNQIVSDSNGAGDEIDARLRELSTLIDISVTRSEDGVVTVSTSDGQFLANAGGFSALGFAPGTSAVVSLSSVEPDSGSLSETAANINASITDGEIGGLLALRNTELPALRAIVENAASGIAAEINAVYAGNASVGATTPNVAPLIVETGSGFAVNQAILDDPSLLAVARPTGGGGGGANDGSGAAAIASLADAPAAQAVASAVTQIGAASRIATDRSATAQTFASEIETRRLSDSGVNLDEELSNLILYQRAYAANARVIAAVDELYQSLLNIL